MFYKPVIHGGAARDAKVLPVGGALTKLSIVTFQTRGDDADLHLTLYVLSNVLFLHFYDRHFWVLWI